MHSLPTIIALNRKAAQREEKFPIANDPRPASFDRQTENGPWPESKGPDRPHGDPLGRK